jgi:hypothetical protein
MSAVDEIPDQFCGCLGCGEAATVVIDHAQHGERPVCDDHAGGHKVIRDV